MAVRHRHDAPTVYFLLHKTIKVLWAPKSQVLWNKMIELDTHWRPGWRADDAARGIEAFKAPAASILRHTASNSLMLPRSS